MKNITNLKFDELKKSIDELIENKQYKKFRRQENYFDVMNNFWIVDKYIAKNGQCTQDLFPNTFTSYEKSIKSGYAICIPVQILDDDNVVCFSHKNISKVISTMSGYLNKLSLNEIKEISLNEDKEKIPTLEEALEFIANRTQIVIEICNEGTPSKFEDKVLNIIQKYIQKFDCVNNVAIMSINPYSLEYFYKEFPYVTRILKSGAFNEKYFGTIPTRKLKNLSFYKITMADFICYTAELLPCRKIRKHKPVGIIANNVVNQNQYISVTPYSDNIIFSHFTPII